MALVISDRIKETTNTVGTQTYQLEGAVTGFETFAANLSDGDTTYYAVTDNTNFEVGLGTINEGASQTINYTVTVVSDGGNKFALNGVTNPVITFVKGFTYVFDVSDNTNGSHPLRFRTSADASYTDGVSISGTQGQAGSTVTIVVASDAPSTLKYYCTSHGNAMGNTINVISAVATLARTTILASSNSNNAVSFGTGAKTIFCTLPAGKAVIKDASNNINGTFVGNITGNVTGNVTGDVTGDVTGNVTGNASGTAATVTGAAQTNITSVGTLTGLTTSGTINLSQTSGAAIKTTGNLGTADLTLLRASGSTDGQFGFDVKYMGSRSGNSNSYSLFMHNQTGTDVEAMTVLQDGKVGINHLNPSARLDVVGDATVTGDLTVKSTDAGASEDPNLVLYRNSSSPADDDQIGTIQFKGRNDNSQDVVYGEIQSAIQDASDGTEESSLNLQVRKDGSAATFVQLSGSSGRVNIQQELFLTTGVKIKFEGDTSNANETTFKVADPSQDNTITLPDATGTVLTTGNSDTPTTTTSSSDADFVLVDDGGTMKKITPTNLGITAGAASLDDATALAIALG